MFLLTERLKRDEFDNGGFTMMKTMLLCLATTLFISPVFADVHKWKDADGKTHYGDAPPIAGTEKVRTDKQTDDQIANGERIKAETETSTRQDAMNEARVSAESSGKCKFEYFVIGDDKGKQLALAAKEECLNNEALRKVGKEYQVRLDAYNAWKDQHQMTQNRRSAAIANGQNAEANRQLNQKLDDIRRTQKYGY